jgi:hypothetical protein
MQRLMRSICRNGKRRMKMAKNTPLDPAYTRMKDGSPIPREELVRFNHQGCGDTKERLYVKRISGGYLFHCHNCAPAFSGFAPDLQSMSPSQVGKELEVKESKERDGSLLDLFPDDFTTNIHLRGWFWLEKYGITVDEVIEHNIGWSQKNRRVILPVYDKEDPTKLLMWQERAVYHDDKPKYRTYRAVLGNSPPHFEIERGKDVVVVEDMLSAIKVGRQYGALCLHGSYISQVLINKLAKYRTVFVWLDPDKYDVAVKYGVSMAKRGLNVRVVKSVRDPKEYSNGDIYDYIEDVRANITNEEEMAV